MMRRVIAAAIAAFALAGCASGSPRAMPATSAAPSQPMPAGCASELALVPRSAPATEQQAAADSDRLAGQQGGTAASMTDQIAADALDLSFDLSQGGSATADVEKYQADVAALRSYCAS